MTVGAIILAAGKGTRMKSALPAAAGQVLGVRTPEELVQGERVLQARLATGGGA